MNAFPFTHTHKYRQITFVDVENYLQRGHNALYSVNGLDKSHVLFVFKSPLDYLTLHWKMITKQCLQQVDGDLTVFRKDPLLMDGSSAITGHFKIDA